MSWLNSSLAAILPIFPKWIARPFAAPYVAGETLDEALNIVQSLNDKGFKATMDILGEHVHSEEEAIQVRDAYLTLYDRIAELRLDSNISLKPTHLGMEIDASLAENNILSILEKAKEHDNFLRIDMENSPYTDKTIHIYNECLNQYPKVGTVLQAYLFRTIEDVQSLKAPSFNCRICKGIYKESQQIALQDRQEINENFLAATKALILGGSYAAIATHDISLIDDLETWIIDKKIPNNRYEFQVLYGVPMNGRLEALLRNGHTVRIYVPFGEAWFDYSIRRLKENPNILWYILKNMFKKRSTHE